jgi:pimeloyl-ACP methyl ester carboxylesterase
MRNSTGLLLPQPFDSNRVPIVFVHGLLSSKYIWRRTALALLQDPENRRRYQFWVFSYPTGSPISFSALNSARGWIGFPYRPSIILSLVIADGATLQTARTEWCPTPVLTSLQPSPKRLYRPATKRWMIRMQWQRFSGFCS